jgi:hypothetical protein
VAYEPVAYDKSITPVTVGSDTVYIATIRTDGEQDMFLKRSLREAQDLLEVGPPDAGGYLC